MSEIEKPEVKTVIDATSASKDDSKEPLNGPVKTSVNLKKVFYVVLLLVIIGTGVVIWRLDHHSSSKGSQAVQQANSKAQQYINDYNNAKTPANRAKYATDAGNQYLSVLEYSQANHWLHIATDEYFAAHNATQAGQAETASNQALAKEQTQTAKPTTEKTTTVTAPAAPKP